MGIYINPEDRTKEQWLIKYGIETTIIDATVADFEVFFPVCLVNNGAFTAAAVCDTLEELEHFMFPDGRQKQLYLVAAYDLGNVLDSHEMTYLRKIT